MESCSPQCSIEKSLKTASDSLFLLLVPVVKGLLELSCKKNLAPFQVVKGEMKIIRTKGLELCPKSPYLCTTPQGRDGCFARKNHEKKKGLSEAWQGLKSRSDYFKRRNRKKKKKKNFRSFLEVQKRFLPLQSQRKRRETKKDKEGRNAHRNIADTEVEAQKFFKKTQSCKRDE
ncbi:hypothetical protein [Sphingobacterium prati]|uniref:hypothetical protein n=1 Tax=Sphingobacterium prati TaxID=2737006 RepID=UPI0039F40644